MPDYSCSFYFILGKYLFIILIKARIKASTVLGGGGGDFYNLNSLCKGLLHLVTRQRRRSLVPSSSAASPAPPGCAAAPSPVSSCPPPSGPSGRPPPSEKQRLFCTQLLLLQEELKFVWSLSFHSGALYRSVI